MTKVFHLRHQIKINTIHTAVLHAKEQILMEAIHRQTGDGGRTPVPSCQDENIDKVRPFLMEKCHI